MNPEHKRTQSTKQWSLISVTGSIYGINVPGVSLQLTVTFPIDLPHSASVLKVSSEVSLILITSSSFIIGTGLKKCRPPKRSFLVELTAISVIGIELVLDVKIVDGGATWTKRIENSWDKK